MFEGFSIVLMFQLDEVLQTYKMLQLGEVLSIKIFQLGEVLSIKMISWVKYYLKSPKMFQLGQVLSIEMFQLGEVWTIAECGRKLTCADQEVTVIGDGCDVNAVCDGENCICSEGFVGNGYTCLGKILSRLHMIIYKYNTPLL